MWSSGVGKNSPHTRHALQGAGKFANIRCLGCNIANIPAGVWYAAHPLRASNLCGITREPSSGRASWYTV